ncbi:MAG TPA: lysophospholipid acyltransferase family protein [Oligoflexia bacterium]|nr:lysophospholipid acyltransferase family protein [Oligoflexia bacterium]
MNQFLTGPASGQSGRNGEGANKEPVSPAKPALIELLLFLPFVLCFLAVLFFFEFAERAARPFGMKRLEQVVGALNRWVVKTLSILGTKIELQGVRKFPADRPYIIVSNHQSMFDISVIHSAFAELRPRFIAKKELGAWIPAISFCLRYEGSALIDRKNKNQSIREIVKFGQRMNQHKFAAVLFPEGTRARDGAIKNFRPAGFSVLLRTVPSAEIIPVAVDGSWRFNARKFGPLPAGVTIRLRAGEVLKRDGKSDEELLEETYQAVSGMLEAMRGGGACRDYA